MQDIGSSFGAQFTFLTRISLNHVSLELRVRLLNKRIPLPVKRPGRGIRLKWNQESPSPGDTSDGCCMPCKNTSIINLTLLPPGSASNLIISLRGVFELLRSRLGNTRDFPPYFRICSKFVFVKAWDIFARSIHYRISALDFCHLPLTASKSEGYNR